MERKAFFSHNSYLPSSYPDNLFRGKHFPYFKLQLNDRREWLMGVWYAKLCPKLLSFSKLQVNTATIHRDGGFALSFLFS